LAHVALHRDRLAPLADDVAYGTNYLIDNKLAIIVDVEATPARWQAEVGARYLAGR
jgi:hypothetical protein